MSTRYEIHSANSLIPLEDYTNYKKPTTPYQAVGGAIFANESDPDRTITTDDAKAHVWDYQSTTYKDDGVKFIYVNFDGTTGEVDYISVRKDAQNVENDELKAQNLRWSNVATNITAPNNIKWVVSPAEAYVNDEGNVEAVVIKSEPTVADLSNVVIVGEYVGSEIGRSTGAEETTPTNAHAREYWQGPNFSEKKTGYFKNQHNVGDIVVIRATTNDVMDCKMFNGGLYSDRNPDVLKAAGITALRNGLDEKSKIAFYVGKNTGYTVLSQNGSVNLANMDGEGKLASIMTNKKVEADVLEKIDELESGYKGLIKVAGAKWIDLRANRGNDDVRSLGDLLDLNEDTVRISVLLNANDSTDSFRRAYAIVVTGGSKDGTASETKGVDGTEIRTTTKVYEKSGAVSYTVTAYRPAWVPDDATLTLTGTISIDGYTKPVTGTLLSGKSSVVLTGVETTGFADASSEITFKWDKALWSKVKVESNADKFDGLAVNTTWLPTDGTTATVSFTNPGTDYLSGTVTVKQNGATLATRNLTSRDFGGGSPDLTVSVNVNNSKGAVTVEFDLRKTVVDIEPALNQTEQKRTDAPATSTTAWVKGNLKPGVYILEGLDKTNANDGPFGQTCDSRDTRTFVYQRNGEQGDYTLKIGPVNGTADETVFNEKFTAPTTGDTEKGIFNVQVSKNYSNVFHNSGSTGTNGTMAGSGTPLTAGEYPWAITSPSGKVLADGTITVEDLGMIEGNTGSYVADVGIANKPADIMKPDGTKDGEATANARQDYYIQQIKNLQDGAYTMPNIQSDIEDATSPLEALNIGSTSSNDVRLWKIAARSKNETYTFYLYSTNGTTLLHDESVVLSETSSAALFSLQVTGSPFHNKTGNTQTLSSTLSAGTYHWVVRSGDEIVKQGDIII